MHIAELTTAESVLSRYPDFRIAAFPAGVPLEFGYEVLSDEVTRAKGGQTLLVGAIDGATMDREKLLSVHHAAT